MLSFNLIILLGGLGLAALSIYLFTSALIGSNADEEALAWASGNEPTPSKSGLINFSRPLVHNFALQHAQKVKSESYRNKVAEKITTSGLEQELNVDEYIGLQILWGFMAPLILCIANFALQMGFSYPLCLSVGLLGFAFPGFYCGQNKKNRYNSVVIDLPFFIDLMALSTEAGLDFINAIQRIVDKAEDSVLAEEFQTVLKDIKLGSTRADALKKLAARLDMPEITSFCAVVIDADYTGASIATVLKDQSEQMRMDRFMRAEKAGAKASQAILIPMLLFILPAVFIMIFSPIAINFFTG